MGKKQEISKLTNLLCKSLRHKIGSIVNPNEFYAGKYARDAEVLLREAEKVVITHNWNSQDKKTIKDQLTKKLRKELEEKTFINEQKFDLMDGEIKKVLEELKLI
ncbi:MAG: hypothetical protein Q8O84_05690 [Nanoarchaeota archaeon]|nr:hypothetical protein [Nanoarchaeota archaeon]